MADESAELKGSIAGQSISIVTKDVLPVLLLLAGLVGGYLVWRQVDYRFETFQAHHLRMFELFIQDQQQRRDQTETLIKQLTILNYNIGRAPEEQIPLGLNGPPPAKPPAP
jgi:hypothetical protein